MRYKILAILLILAIVGLSIFCENSVKKVNNKNLKKISKLETKTKTYSFPVSYGQGRYNFCNSLDADACTSLCLTYGAMRSF